MLIGIGLSLGAVGKVNVTPVNTVPAAQTVNEDTALTFSIGNGNLISVADSDATSLTVSLSVSHGTLTLSRTTGLSFSVGDGTSDASMTFAGSPTNINAALSGMTYTGSSNYNGSDTLTITTTDGIATDTDTVAITVSAVNDPPVNTVPAGQTVEAGRSLTFSSGNGNAISVSDVESTSLTVTIAVSGGGTLTLGGTTGLSFSAGDGTADATMTFSGTTSAINTALNGLVFAATMASTGGSATLTVTTSDGVAQDVDTVAITINAFDPTALPGFKAWYDKGDQTLIYSDRAGTTLVSSLNDPIGRYVAKAGTGAPYFSAPLDSNRGLWKAMAGGVGNGVKYDGIDDHYVAGNATFFDFMHQSTGFTFFATLAFTFSDSTTIQCIYDNTDSDNTNYGVSLQVREDGANQGVPSGWVGKPVTGVWYFSGTNNSHGTSRLTIAVAHQYGVSGNDGVVRWNGSQVIGAESTAAPGSSSALRSMRRGLTTTGARPGAFTERDELYYSGKLSDANLALLEAWGATR